MRSVSTASYRYKKILQNSLLGSEGLTNKNSSSEMIAGSLNNVGLHQNLTNSMMEINDAGRLDMREDIIRISEAILPNLQKPFLMVEDGITIESVIRNAFQVPAPQYFITGSAEIPLPNLWHQGMALEKYIDDRCPRVDTASRTHLAKLLFKINTNQDGLNALLKLAPSEDVRAYQLPWYEIHMSKACKEEQKKVNRWINLSLEDETLYLTSLFLAFNFEIIIVSRLSYILNGYRYSQIGLSSPFVYMMV